MSDDVYGLPVVDTQLLAAALSDGDAHDDDLRSRVVVTASGAMIHGDLS